MLAEARASAGGELNAQLANAAVRLHSRLLGRGPTRAQAFYRHNVVVLLLRDAFTPVERALIAAADADAALVVRAEYNRLVGPGLTAAVAAITGHIVVALMSDAYVDPDVVAHVLLLDAPLNPQAASAATAARKNGFPAVGGGAESTA